MPTTRSSMYSSTTMSTFNAASKPTDEAQDQPSNLANRSSVVGSDKGAVFLIGYNDVQRRKVPDRLRQYGTRTTTTAEELQRKQQLAADRKKKHDENKARQARKVSQEAMNFDKKVQARLNNVQQQQRWFDSAFKK